MEVIIPRLSLLPVFLREVFAQRTLNREPEPALVMEDESQVAAFAEAGRIDGALAASYLFNTARISQVLANCETVIDLGCGPATQLAQVAELNPEISFSGVELSREMILSAEKHINDKGLNNVSFVEDDITTLEQFEDHSVDAVISTVTLHHLPTREHLQSCFRQIKRVLRPGGAVYLIDFGRLKSLKSVIFFAYMNRGRQPDIFSLDYERSLRAAFTLEDFEALAETELTKDVQVMSTFKMPFMVITKTKDLLLPETKRIRLREMRKSLSPRHRRDLDDLRLFFRLGGLRNDSFTGAG